MTLLPDDLPPAEMARSDWLLRQQLDRCLERFFYDACLRDVSEGELRSRQALLQECEWSIATHAEATVLAIRCPSFAVSWRILKSLVPLGRLLESLAIARLRIYTPILTEIPLEVRVDELSIYQDSLN
ncbi:MAG: hypothetical protein SVX43_09360 [Cyanobacteriota bacterium]|nr:hypothetical protein [Cyanobacteriota bacterium]